MCVRLRNGAHAGEALLVEIEVEPGVAVTHGCHGCKSRSSRILYEGSRERRGESRLEQREGLFGMSFEMASDAREEEQQLRGAFFGEVRRGGADELEHERGRPAIGLQVHIDIVRDERTATGLATLRVPQYGNGSDGNERQMRRVAELAPRRTKCGAPGPVCAQRQVRSLPCPSVQPNVPLP